MSAIDFQTIESYLLTDNKQEFLQHLVPGTESYLYFTLLHSLNTANDVPKDVEEQLKEYRSRFNNSASSQLHIRTLLKKYDTSSSTNKEEIINELVRLYLHLNFNYSKPSNIVTSSLQSNQHKLPSVLDPKTVQVESELPKMYNNVNELSQFQLSVLSRADTKKLLSGDPQVLERFVFSATPTDFDEFPSLVVELMNKKKTGPNYVYGLLDRLSLEQLQQLAKLNAEFMKDSQFVQSLCKKTFKISSFDDLGQDASKQQKRDLTYKFYQWAKQQQTPFASLISNATYQILQVDLQLNKYDKDLFVEFLKTSTTRYSQMAEEQKRSVNSRPHDPNPVPLGAEYMRVDELIRVYLEEFFRDAKDTQPFTQYLDSRYLNEVFYSTKLMLGKPVEAKDALSPEKLRSLAESKELTVCRHNQEYYKKTDVVNIAVTIKNIPSLMVKIFEFRPENYYLKERKQLDGSINLDGLIAAEELNIDFKEPPVRKFVHEFSFDSISTKPQGIFIVDFIGNGLSSRVVIRKGRLAYIEHQTVAGQLFTIVDEEANICKGDRTGLWVKERFYKADEQGRILVPYSSTQSEEAVLVHNDYAELSNIELKAESFEFKCAYIYNYESLLMGNKAKLLVQPRLFLNQQPIGLDIIKECNAVVTLVNDDNIPLRVSFDKLKLSASEELELEFSVPAKVRDITVDVTAKIIPIHKREPKDYTSQHRVQVDLNKGSAAFCSLFLRYNKEGYELFVLGKNGEPKPNVTVALSFQNRYLNRRINQSLQTDPNGKLSLGKMEEITYVEANLQSVGDIQQKTKSWTINSHKAVNYPDNLRVCEGNQIVLPLLHSELNRHRLSFLETLRDGSVISNHLDVLKVDKNKLAISGLKEGFYTLQIKDVQQTVTITVLKGIAWSQNSSFLLSNNSLIDVKNDINNIVITDIEVSPKAGSEVADIVIQAYVDQPKLARFHVFGAQFLESNINRTVDNLDANLPLEMQREAYLKPRESQFLNNRKLGEEYCYVLDRKSKTRYMGNTLEKPAVLLKRTFVRDTETKEEDLAATQEFQGQNLKEERSYSRQLGAAGRGEMLSMKREKMASSGSSYQREIEPNSFLNFLANPSVAYTNLQVDQNGTFTVTEFPYKQYSFLHIVATNLTSNISTVFPLDSSTVPTKDLTQKARDNDAVFSVSRVSTNVTKDQTFQVKDLTSTDIQIIDSLPRLFDIQKNLALSSNNPANSETYSRTWEFLREWATLEHQQKLKKYDEFASHELNVFVFFKDQKFFAEVVVPFLRNKIEKSAVDYILLDDKKRISEYAQAEEFEKLNCLEQVLVISRIQKTQAEEAKRLSACLENKNAVNVIDSNVFNRYFDTVLTSKKPEDDPDNAPGSLQQRDFRQMEEGVMYSMAAAPRMRMGINKKSAMPDSFGASRMQFCSLQSEEVDLLGASLDQGGYAESNFDNGDFLKQRDAIQAGFQELEKTKEYAERHYYGRVDKHLHIPLNAFWVDFAKHVANHSLDQSFLTQSFLFAQSSVTEMIAVLSLLSLPFKPQMHAQTSYEGRGLEIRAASDLIVLTKAVAEAQSDVRADILIIQRFFDPQDRHTESEDEPGVQVEKDVDQYIINKVYGASVIITNSSTSRQQFQVLVEVPEGSIPVQNLDYTKSHTLTLGAFTTQTIEFFFYFPSTGAFRANPPSVSKKSKVVAIGKNTIINVKTEKTYATLETLNAVLTQGSKDDILNFTRTKNIWNPKVFDFSAIYWLLQDKDFFLQFIQILRDRKHFNSVVWQFGFKHNDAQTVREYLASNSANPLSQHFLYLDSSLLCVDKLKLLEYHPFVNQRVHLLAGEKNRILNVQLREQYTAFVTYLSQRRTLQAEHYLGLVYYLLLQDRVDDAIRLFSKIDREEVRHSHQHELQYDYFAAYIDFYMGYPKFAVARDVCQKYLEYPVLSWRSLFVEIASQLAEFDGQEVIENEAPNEKKQNTSNATKEEVVTLDINHSTLHITHQNVAELTLAFYRVDLEVLFSRNPFITQSKDEFSFIRPKQTQKIQVTNLKDLGKTTHEIPESLRRYNLYIELRAGDKIQSTTYFSTSLKVQVLDNYGQVKVLDQTDKPLIKVYVKAFAQGKDGKVSFYKDGYTDLRGRFDYATLNSSDISNIEKFGIFVMSDEFGSLVKEAKAPSKLGKVQTHLLPKKA